MNIIPEIFILAFIGIIFFAFVFFKYPRWAIAGLIIAKPAIDLTWNYYIIFSINFLKIYTGVFVLLGIVYILKNRYKILDCPIGLPWLIFLILNFISIFIISERNLLDKFEYFLRVLTGFITLILFFNIFDFEKDKKFVLSIFIYPAIICILIWLFEAFSKIPRTSVAGISDELTRIKGPYHDFFHFPFYGLQLIICALPLLVETNKTNQTNRTNQTNKTNESNLTFQTLTTTMLYLLIAISIFIIYKSYTKGGWITLPVILFLWFILRKKFIPALLVVVGVILFISLNPFRSEASSLFRKEIDILILRNQKWEPDTLFMGRYRRWRGGMQEFNKMPLMNKLFGAKKSPKNPENDYLRILWHNGIIGLIVFILLLLQSIYLIVRNYIKNKDPVFLTGIFVIIMYLTSAIGSYPLFYPAFQWLLWGIVGFVLSEQKARKDSCGIDKKGIVINGIESSTAK